jgi:hypothetical protein
MIDPGGNDVLLFLEATLLFVDDYPIVRLLIWSTDCESNGC